MGVVLLNLGGPETLDDVQPFLYRLLMDPALLDLPVKGRVRHWLAKSISYFRADTLAEQYEMIGGGSPLTRLTREQAESLQRHLNDRYSEPAGVDFRTYTAMRYWHPFSEEAARQMRDDGVDKVVLLPLYPQYSASTTGSSLAYWKALEEANEISSWPTTSVPEYAANPKYVQAVSERIDEALQRFPEDVRDDVALVFSAHGTPFQRMGERQDPYCCHVHSTVEQVMRLRGRDHPYHTAFQSLIGPNHWLKPSTLDTLEAVVDRGCRSVLVVPISFVTDHVNVKYELDVEMREEVEAYGMDHFEVTASLNTHPLFIEALGEATVAQLKLPMEASQLQIGGDGVSRTYRLRPLNELSHHTPGNSSAQCPRCNRTVGARRWTAPEPSSDPEVTPERTSVRPSASSEHGSESRSRTAS